MYWAKGIDFFFKIKKKIKLDSIATFAEGYLQVDSTIQYNLLKIYLRKDIPQNTANLFLNQK